MAVNMLRCYFLLCFSFPRKEDCVRVMELCISLQQLISPFLRTKKFTTFLLSPSFSENGRLCSLYGTLHIFFKEGMKLNTFNFIYFVPLFSNEDKGSSVQRCFKPLVLFCFVLFCFVLFCFVLFCFVLFCFVLFCFVFSFGRVQAKSQNGNPVHLNLTFIHKKL